MSELKQERLKCPECGSEEIHTAFCGKENHNVQCMECEHCWFDWDTQNYWDKMMEEEDPEGYELHDLDLKEQLQ